MSYLAFKLDLLVVVIRHVPFRKSRLASLLDGVFG